MSQLSCVDKFVINIILPGTIKFNGFLILAFQFAIDIEGGNFGYKEHRIFHIMVGIEFKRLLAIFAKFLFFPPTFQCNLKFIPD